MALTMTRKELAALGEDVRVPVEAHPTMNKTEQRYAEVLEARRLAGEVREYTYELVTLKLGQDCRWTPDFTVILSDGTLELHECKGAFEREDAKVKRKVAAAQTPFRIVFAQWTKGRGWVVQRVPAA